MKDWQGGSLVEWIGCWMGGTVAGCLPGCVDHWISGYVDRGLHLHILSNADEDANDDCSDRFLQVTLRHQWPGTVVETFGRDMWSGPGARSCIVFVFAGCAALQYRTSAHDESIFCMISPT